ncbi:MAG TPA: hypothetical protein DD719_04680 [Desulfotomaculum sp.]|jgi:predicted DNA-binding protein (UPF0251 family)|nr:hypothetical protein [Desulfotomaculum sp.]HCJ79026.1 hypothetical protein [Desulfotomaculum sp.]
MPRPPKWRTVEQFPSCTYFKPAGIPLRELGEVCLYVEELEALRLKDLACLDQEACAERMKVARTTFQRILCAARAKVAEALVTGKAIRVEGGKYLLAEKLFETTEEENNQKQPSRRCRYRGG